MHGPPAAARPPRGVRPSNHDGPPAHRPGLDRATASDASLRRTTASPLCPGSHRHVKLNHIKSLLEKCTDDDRAGDAPLRAANGDLEAVVARWRRQVARPGPRTVPALTTSDPVTGRIHASPGEVPYRLGRIGARLPSCVLERLAGWGDGDADGFACCADGGSARREGAAEPMGRLSRSASRVRMPRSVVGRTRRAGPRAAPLRRGVASIGPSRLRTARVAWPGRSVRYWGFDPCRAGGGRHRGVWCWCPARLVEGPRRPGRR